MIYLITLIAISLALFAIWQDKTIKELAQDLDVENGKFYREAMENNKLREELIRKNVELMKRAKKITFRNKRIRSLNSMIDWTRTEGERGYVTLKAKGKRK